MIRQVSSTEPRTVGHHVRVGGNGPMWLCNYLFSLLIYLKGAAPPWIGHCMPLSKPSISCFILKTLIWWLRTHPKLSIYTDIHNSLDVMPGWVARSHKTEALQRSHAIRLRALYAPRLVKTLVARSGRLTHTGDTGRYKTCAWLCA